MQQKPCSPYALRCAGILPLEKNMTLLVADLFVTSDLLTKALFSWVSFKTFPTGAIVLSRCRQPFGEVYLVTDFKLVVTINFKISASIHSYVDDIIG